MRKLALILLLPLCSWGTTYVWKGTAGDGKWSTSTNWSPTRSSPSSGDSMQFDNTCTSCASTVDATVNIFALTIQGTYANTITQAGSTTLSLDGAFSIAGGTYAGNASAALHLANAATITGGTVTLNSEPITFNTANFGSSTITCSGNFNTLTGAGSITVSTSGSGSVTIASGCAVTAALSQVSSLTVTGAFTASGDSSINGTLSGAGTFNGSTNTNILGTIDTTSGTWSFTNVNYTTSSFGTGQLSCSGNFNSATGATVTLSTAGSGAFQLNSGCTVSAAITQVANLTINGTLLSTGSTGTVGGNVVIGASGLFTGPTGGLSVAGNWTSSGTYNGNGGTVSPTDAAHTFAGSTTFYNLTLVATGAARTVTFTAGTTQTVTHTFSANGASGKLLSLHSSSSPSTWAINNQGSCSVSFVSVKDSVSSSSIYAGTSSTNEGNNTNWNFSAGVCGLKVRHSVTGGM